MEEAGVRQVDAKLQVGRKMFERLHEDVDEGSGWDSREVTGRQSPGRAGTQRPSV